MQETEGVHSRCLLPPLCLPTVPVRCEYSTAQYLPVLPVQSVSTFHSGQQGSSGPVKVEGALSVAALSVTEAV